MTGLVMLKASKGGRVEEVLGLGAGFKVELSPESSTLGAVEVSEGFEVELSRV